MKADRTRLGVLDPAKEPYASWQRDKHKHKKNIEYGAQQAWKEESMRRVQRMSDDGRR